MRGRSLYALAAGLCDTATGALLLISPSWTLRLMRVPWPEADPVWLRFIGAFVAGVGLVYLVPRWVTPIDRGAALAMVLLSTAVVRAVVGSFVTVALIAGAIDLGWISVAVTDLALAGAQGWMLARGGFRDVG